ncbi:SAM-dependent methyltransferase [Sciscionella sediminilitoris]|uniref:SAM-dependent methyltransferase n=1 Tax=Sciscionella sediminilitoris TaxID=1445613 RepID=UPI00068E2D73|nr:SAM-dependent methyltransferase [Sciscionella sp. SE31]
MTTPNGVGLTSVLVAEARARESRRADRLFEDPFAQRFVDASGWQPSAESRRTTADRYGFTWVSLRTRFLDDVLREALDDGCTQVVLLGAGLDTRALRLGIEVPVFELDTAEVHAFKRSVLHEPSSRVEVVADLREDWPDTLRALGFRADRRTAWIAEGVLLYLSAAEVEAVLTQVSALSVPGSVFGTTLTPAGYLDRIETPAEPDGDPLAPGNVAAMWRSDGPADPAGWFAGFGWRATVFRPGERARAYGRDFPDNPNPNRLLVSAVRETPAPRPDTGTPR